jgi:hypothetical protein
VVPPKKSQAPERSDSDVTHSLIGSESAVGRTAYIPTPPFAAALGLFCKVQAEIYSHDSGLDQWSDHSQSCPPRSLQRFSSTIVSITG